MIIAHLFLRKNRNRMYVMCETTSSRGVKPPYPTPEQMFEVELSDDQSEWEERIRKSARTSSSGRRSAPGSR